MGTSVTRAQAAALGVLAALLLLVAWLAAPPAGPLMALAGGVLGWMLSRIYPTAPVAPPAAIVETVMKIPVETHGRTPDDWTKQLSLLRHDLRGILSPAMLIADRLLAHEDPAVQRAGDIMNRTIERAAARLMEKPASGGEG
jgi:hypothetical protein